MGPKVCEGSFRSRPETGGSEWILGRPLDPPNFNRQWLFSSIKLKLGLQQIENETWNSFITVAIWNC